MLVRFILTVAACVMMVPCSAFSASLVDKAVDAAVNSVDPDADADSRYIAKEAAKSILSPTSEGTGRHMDNAEQRIREMHGESSGKRTVIMETYKGDIITAVRIMNLGETYDFRYKGNRIHFPTAKMRSLHCKDERGNGRMVLVRNDGKSFEFTGSNANIVSDWKQGHYSTVRYEFEDEVTDSIAKSWIKTDKIRTIRFE